MQSKNGFTILEIIVALTVFGFIVLTWESLILQSYRSTTFGQQQLEAIRQAQRGIEIMTQELREASQSQTGAYPIAIANDDEIVFYSDIDQDIYTERVRYFLDNTTLKKGVIEPTGSPLTYTGTEIVTTIAEYVNNQTQPMFVYYNGNYPYDTLNNPLPAPARLIETKLLHIFLRINVDPNIAPLDFDVESEVQLRNLKTNL